MRLAPLRHRRRSENIVPMINVVFLLLIFFLMTAEIAPPDPVDVAPPSAAEGEAGRAEDRPTLYLAADGTLAFEEARGTDAVLSALTAAAQAACAAGCPEGVRPALVLRADAGLPAARLAALMPRLAEAGFAEISLVTVPR